MVQSQPFMESPVVHHDRGMESKDSCFRYHYNLLLPAVGHVAFDLSKLARKFLQGLMSKGWKLLWPDRLGLTKTRDRPAAQIPNLFDRFSQDGIQSRTTSSTYKLSCA